MALIACAFNSEAQVTITHTSLPQPGDTFAMHYDANPTINYGIASPSSQHFDFTQLQTTTDKYAAYGITANLPFASEYPQSNLYTYGPSVLYGGPGASVPSGNGWMLFRTDVNGMDVIGYRTDNGGNDISTLENPPRMLMRTPCTLGLHETQDAVWTYTFDVVPTNADTIYKSFSHTEITCDAWGTLSTPIDNNINVVRVHKNTLVVDSAYAVVGGTVYWKGEIQRVLTNNYDFYTPDKRHPIATVFCDAVGTIQGAEYLYYSDLYAETEGVETDDFSIYPNPTSDFVYIDFNYSLAQYELYNLNGRKIHQGEVAKNVPIDFSSYEKGIYILILQTSQGVVMKRIIKN
ncbi:MAG: T9SS type A sorting domain-containing protein [Crocinitomicaceae bacterium]|nr:T9SS type A sorting domain-containing protein [Crocinitomicaceae bacterium]